MLLKSCDSCLGECLPFGVCARTFGPSILVAIELSDTHSLGTVNNDWIHILECRRLTFMVEATFTEPMCSQTQLRIRVLTRTYAYVKTARLNLSRKIQISECHRCTFLRTRANNLYLHFKRLHHVLDELSVG